MTSSHADLALQVELNRLTFAKLRSEAAQVLDPAERVAVIAKAAKFAAHTGTGVFRAPDLDRLLYEISDTLPPVTRGNRGGVLHVMTQAYLNGGHTRVVERWIEQDGKRCAHSVVLTAQGGRPIPPRLASIAKASGGSIVKLDARKKPIDRAVQLRSLSARFDHIVTHAHMHDVVPALSFGAIEEPVIFFNHADHRFSLGMSAPYVIAETRTWGKDLSVRRRGIIGTRVLGIPLRHQVDQGATSSARCIARDKLNLPYDATVAVVAGSSHKFTPMLEYDFFRFVCSALEEVPNLFFLLIGASGDSAELIMHSNVSQRIRLHPVSDETVFQRIVAASDFAIDTFPENGCTTLMDMVQAGLPVLTRQAPTGQMNYLMNSSEDCADDAELLHQVMRFSDSSFYRFEIYREQSERLHIESEPTVFLKRLATFYDDARTASARPGAHIGQRDEKASELDYLLALSRS